MSCSNLPLSEGSVEEIRESSFLGEEVSLEYLLNESFAGEFLPSKTSPRGELLPPRENNTSVGETPLSESFPGEGDEHVVDIDFQNDTFPCVFRVPKSLTEAKPETYVPQKLGLGPFHHLRQDLYTMHTKKLADVIKFLDGDEKGHENIERVKQHLEKREYLIRTSYGECLDVDRPTLARIVAIDAIYLLTYFDHHQESPDNINPEMKKKLGADMLMLENQIPGNLLLEIWGILNRGGEGDVLFRNVLSFCEQESPLKLTEMPNDVLPLMREGHLLNVLYNLVLPNDSEMETRQRATRERRRKLEQAEKEAKIAAAIGVPGAKEIAAEIAAELAKRSRRRRHKRMAIAASDGWAPPGQVDLASMAEFASAIVGAHTGAIIQKEVSVMQKVPWALISNMLKLVDPDRKENSLVEEICIPSVSKLTRYAGITFAPVEGGIRNVKFDPKGRKFDLPALTLDSNSEVVLRNLLAYEAAISKPGSTLELAEYVDLMCGIVDTPKDVEILREVKIIVSDLKPAEIAHIFNEIRRSTGDEDKHNTEKTNIGKAIKEVNEVYGSIARVKVSRFTKKYFYKSWKFLAVLSSVLALILLASQAFCVIYDCNKHWLATKNCKYNPLRQVL